MNSEEQSVRNQAIVDQFKSGLKEKLIAQSFGITRERVRQILNSRLGKEAKRAQLKGNRDSAKAQKAALIEAERMAPSDKTCKTCLGPVPAYRARRTQTKECRGITCSPRCAKLWFDGRTLIDPAEWKIWRKSLDRSSLKSKRPSERRRGQRALGLPIEPYTHPGSAAMRHEPWKVWQKQCAERRTSKAYKAYDEVMRLRAERNK